MPKHRGAKCQRGDPRIGKVQRRNRRACARLLPCPCSRCGEMVEVWHDWHVDHLVAVAHGGAAGTVAPAHAACNLKAGGQTRRPPNAVPSRAW